MFVFVIAQFNFILIFIARWNLTSIKESRESLRSITKTWIESASKNQPATTLIEIWITEPMVSTPTECTTKNSRMGWHLGWLSNPKTCNRIRLEMMRTESQRSMKTTKPWSITRMPLKTLNRFCSHRWFILKLGRRTVRHIIIIKAKFWVDPPSFRPRPRSRSIRTLLPRTVTRRL